jgi:hypothetical protein
MPSVDTLYPVLPRFVQLLSVLQYYIYLIKEVRNSSCADHYNSGPSPPTKERLPLNIKARPLWLGDSRRRPGLALLLKLKPSNMLVQKKLEIVTHVVNYKNKTLKGKCLVGYVRKSVHN